MKKEIEFAYLTDIGKIRKNNEDRATTLNFGAVQLLVVCDGMGGHRKGEVASELALDIVASSFENGQVPTNEYRAKKMLKRVLREANSEINKLSSADCEYADMGTTIVLALVLEDVTVICNCGDSRAYCYSRESGLRLLTTDQTYVQYLYETGRITKEEMATHPKRHVLMNAMGINPSCTYDVLTVTNDYEALLLVSDGFSNMVSFREIEQFLALEARAKDKVDAMLARALANGGTDNIAINLMEVKNENR